VQIRKLDRPFRNLGSLYIFLRSLHRNLDRQNSIFSANLLFWRQKSYRKFRLNTMRWNLKEFVCWLYFDILFKKNPLYLKIKKNNDLNEDIQKMLSNSISVWQVENFR
jgi:hypothetical protein